MNTMNSRKKEGVVMMVVGLLIFVLIGIYAFSTRGRVSNIATPEVPQQNEFDPKNATYTINGKNITLINGVAQTPAAPGSKSMTTTRYFGNEARGDLTGDSKDDIAYLISEDTGGSGLFYYAVVAIKTDKGYTVTNPFFIGDRIAPQSTQIQAMELHVNYAERKPGEPMTAQPSVGAVKLLKVTPEGILNGLMQ